MAPKAKSKMCWNCDGSTSVEEEHCPFCGVYLSPIPGIEDSKHNILFDPPYKVKEEEIKEAPPSPYQTYEKESSISAKESSKVTNITAKTTAIPSEITPLILISWGLVLLLFSLSLFLFSKNNVLSLQWNAEYWFLYFTFSGLMLWFGWRQLRKIQEKES